MNNVMLDRICELPVRNASLELNHYTDLLSCESDASGINICSCLM